MREQHLDDVVLRGVLAQYVMVVKMFGHGIRSFKTMIIHMAYNMTLILQITNL